MEFTSREDIEAPIEFVFDQVSDFASFERSVMRRGGDVERVAQGRDDGLGAKWHVQFMMRGVERDIKAEVVKADRPNLIELAMTSPSADANLVVELVALSRARTRLNVRVEASAKSIPAKLFFQSLRFARQKTKARFNGLVANFAKEIDTKYRS